MTRTGLCQLSEDVNSIPVDYYVDYYYDYSTSGYIEKATVNKYNDNVLFIDKVGIITKAEELELQHLDITNKKYLDAPSETRIIPNLNNKITFQQKGLNSGDNTSFNTYVRFMIETKEDVDIIYDENDFDLTYEELQQLDEELHQQIASSYMQEPGMKILEWQGTSIKEVNGRKTFKVRFTMQLNDHPLVNVEIYYFIMNQKVHLVSLSCRISEEDKWKPILNNMLYSFKTMTHSFTGE